MNNPLPVDRFCAADAARRTWPMLIESMIEAVCLVEPDGLRIVAANAQAGRLHGVPASHLVGQDMRDIASTPEDVAFWREVADGRWTGLWSESLVSGGGDRVVPVTRRVSRIEPQPGHALYVVAWQDRSEELMARRGAEVREAELRATLESIGDGVLVVDLGGHIGHFNRRFAALWQLPADMVALRADDEVWEWMRSRVADPRGYSERLAWIEADPDRRAVDRIELRSGGAVERVSTPQRIRGRATGRVHTFRELAAPAPPAQSP